MLFQTVHILIEKELNRMKRLLRICSALCVVLVLGWYCLPGVYRVLHLPDCVDAETDLAAPAIAAWMKDARFVRGSGDERLSAVAGPETEIRLFGFLPLKTVRSASQGRTVVPGGDVVGVVLQTEGVQIVGFDRIDTAGGTVSPAFSAGLREGDMICAVNGQAVADSASFADLCASAGETCELSCLRDGKAFTVQVSPVSDRSGEKRIGAWVRDSTSGIGTLSFYDAATGAYAALGHGVTDVDTQKLIAPATGFLTKASILQIRKSGGSAAGELIGRFSTSSADAVATVERNTPFGIAGTLTRFSDAGTRSIGIAPRGAAHRGKAVILSAANGTVTEYTVNVIRVDVQSSPETQGMMIEITDPELLRQTGGIVQGMSGSPLIQDGRLIGVVTHVFISRPTRGYCLYAEWMEKELLQ